MQQHTAVLATLVGYKALLVAIGLLAQRRTRDNVDFYLGGRKLGPTVASISASASSSSAWTLLGVSGAAYAWGLAAFWIIPACVGGYVFNWYVLAPKLQRLSHTTEAVTITSVLAATTDGRLKKTIVWVSSLIILGSLGSYVAAQFQGAGKTFNHAFGLSFEMSVLIGGSIVILYTMLGGFWAVSLTDTLQGLIMAGVSVALPAVALIKIGGFSELLVQLRGVPIEGYSSLTAQAHGPAAVGLVIGILGIGLGYPGQPHVVNRFMALADTPGSLVRARRIAVGWGLVVYAGMVCLGLCGRVLLPVVPDHEQILLAVSRQLMHPVAAGVVIAAVLSAIMSTADSQLLVVASTLTHDLRLGGSRFTNLLLRARVGVLVFSSLAIVAALVGTTELFKRVLFAWTAMGCSLGPVLLVTVLRGPMVPAQALVAMVAGYVLSVTTFLLPMVNGGVMERVVPFAVACGIALFPIRRFVASQGPAVDRCVSSSSKGDRGRWPEPQPEATTTAQRASLGT